jgi:hypothetical protein
MKQRIWLGWMTAVIVSLCLGAVLFMASKAQARAVDRQTVVRGSTDGAANTFAAVDTSFTFQGSLMDGDSPANGEYDFEFKLYDSPSAGSQISVTFPVADVMVSNGLFNVALDFGDVYDGTALWLAIGVRPGSSTGAYTALSPRQPLTAAPYSMFALKVAEHDHWGQTWEGDNFGLTIKALGNFGNATAFTGRTINQGTGVLGLATPLNASANLTVPTGVAGISLLPAGGLANRTYGLYGQASGTGGYGVFGYGTFTGTYGLADGSAGVGVYGESTGSNGSGVFGKSTNGNGLRGEGVNGLYAQSPVSNGTGVLGEANTGSLAFGVWGISSAGYAGYFSGKVNVTGNLTKAGGNFRIDHPLDPANMYLNHSFVESPDMKNIYDGVVTLDANGMAIVTLPDWFEALNRDFRYQLTCIGGYAPVYVAQEIQNGTFTIAGGTPGLKVSWQVTGIRQDPWANDNRIPVEEPKPPEETGTYLYPQGYGQPETLSVDHSRIQQLQDNQKSMESESNASFPQTSPPGVWIQWPDESSTTP